MSASAATREDMDRLHERLDSLFILTTETKQAVVVHVASCEPCRSVVLGNGKRPISDRVTAIETEMATVQRISGWVVTKIIAAAGVVFTAIEIALKML